MTLLRLHYCNANLLTYESFCHVYDADEPVGVLAVRVIVILWAMLIITDALNVMVIIAPIVDRQTVVGG